MIMNPPFQVSWAPGSMAHAFRQWSGIQRFETKSWVDLAALQTHAGIA